LSRDENSNGEEREKKIYLTAEMVNVQFGVPDLFDSRERNIREE
jgi:hypothetical protein